MCIFRNSTVNPANNLLLIVRFYATGESFLIDTGDFVEVSETTACRIMQKLTIAIVQLHLNLFQCLQQRDRLN